MVRPMNPTSRVCRVGLSRGSRTLGVPWPMYDQQSALIATPADVDDVIAVVNFARTHDLRIVPQRTGHDASPLGAIAGTVLLRTDAMCDVMIDPTWRMGAWRGREVGGRRSTRLEARPGGAARVHSGREHRRLLQRRRGRLVRAQARGWRPTA
jgi:FAD binding domain